MNHTFKVFSTALLAVLVTFGIANAQVLNLVPNGDFSTPGGADWGSAVGGGAPDPLITFPTSGGNLGGFGQIDSTAGGWGVLVSQDIPIPLASLGLTAGQSYDINWDMIDLGAGHGGASSAEGGIKMESWAAGGLLNDTGDVVFTAVPSTWTNYTLNYMIDPGADAVKFVPLSTTGGNIGFDNVGVLVIPEPGSVGVIALGMIGLIARRRRS